MSRTRIHEPSYHLQLGEKLFAIPFSFNFDTEYLEQLAKDIMTFIDATYNQIASVPPEEIKFETVVQPLIDLEIFIAKAKTLVTFPTQVHPDEKIRQTSDHLGIKLDNKQIDCEQRKDVYLVLQTYEKSSYSFEASNLSHEQKRYFRDLMNEYRRNGLSKTDRELDNITDIKKRISELATHFEANMRNDNTSFIFNRNELEGLPESWFTKEREVMPGQYKVTLKYPDFFPVMDYVKNRNVRKQLYIAYYSRCQSENLFLLTAIVKARQVLAQSLGYPTYVDFMAEIRMAKTGQTIRKFLDEMLERFKPLFQARLKKLATFAASTEQNFKLENYDMKYYNRLLIKKELNLDIEKFNSYFSLDKVVQGTFKIYENLLGLKFIEDPFASSWHQDVKLFDVFNNDSDIPAKNKKIGSFYLDLYPREGKYSHAAAMDLLPGADISHLTHVPHERQLPIVAMVCNLPKGSNYLSFEQDVITFFHEFGHVMHYICSKANLPGFHSFNTELDFVEAPSQMLENWCYDHRILSLLSSHPETKEPIPKEMVSKLKELRIAHETLENMRQLVLGNFDYAIHSLDSEASVMLDIKNCFNQIKNTILHPLTTIENECFASSFEHMVGEYAVGYYGYLMTQVYAIDMFVTHFHDNPFNPLAGAYYRKMVLEPGSTLDGMEILTNFLGRSPTFHAFINYYGLEKNISPLQKLGLLSNTKRKLDESKLDDNEKLKQYQ